jgi:hypothetical protein
MPLTSIVLDKDDASTTTFTLIGQTNEGGEYRLVSRALNKPLSLQFAYKVGNAGSLSNDHLVITVKDVGVNSETSDTFTSSVKVDLSLSRNSEVAAFCAQDLMSYLGDLFTQAAWRDEIASGQLPATTKV